MNDEARPSTNLKTFLENANDRPLSDQEFSEQKKRFVHFFSLLIEIDRKNKAKGKELLLQAKHD